LERPFERAVDLGEVGALVGVVEGVKEHALLHGGERGDGEDACGLVADEGVELELVEGGEREVGGGDAAGAGGGAVFDEGAELSLEVEGEYLDALSSVSA
jgi:hypothetical protein